MSATERSPTDWVVSGDIITVGHRIDERIRLLDQARGARVEQADRTSVSRASSARAWDAAAAPSLGADDLLVKPVQLEELMAGLRALLRRCSGNGRHAGALQHGALCVVPARRTVTHNGDFIPLTYKKFGLLEMLLRGKGRVLSRRHLEEALHSDADIASNPVEVHVHHLRRKLGSDVIKTVRGVGYTMGAE